MNKEQVTAYALGGVGAVLGVNKYYIKPELTAKRAWGVIAAGVLAYELACPQGELLSEGVDRGLESKPTLTRLAIGVTALHLLNVLPTQMDPFHYGLRVLKRL